MTIALIVFWSSIAIGTWVYVMYPAVARACARLRPVHPRHDSGWPALVSIGIAVHNGARRMGDRLDNVLGQAPPFPIEVVVASDGSDDDTVEIVRQASASEPRISLLDLRRGGQSAAQAAIFGAARGEIVVLTDVDTRFAPGCLEALVTPLRDPAIGCVTGVLKWQFDAPTATARHEGLYWRYEQAVRAWESRAGWLTAATGALLAVRRALYKPVPAHASLDQMLPLIARDAGQLVVVAEQAIGSDRGPVDLGEQLRSRTRIATQGIEANLRMASRITPWRRPGSFLAIWSHKLLRWTTPWLALAAAASGALLAAGGDSPIYLLPAGTLGVVVLAASVGYAAHRRARHVPLTGFPLTVMTVNAAFALAWINWLLRRRVAAWEATARLPEV